MELGDRLRGISLGSSGDPIIHMWIMTRVFSINQGYKVKKRACAARRGNSAPTMVLTNEPVTCRRALWATRQALGMTTHHWVAVWWSLTKEIRFRRTGFLQGAALTERIERHLEAKARWVETRKTPGFIRPCVCGATDNL